MASLIKEVKSYRLDTEEQVTEFLESEKEKALEEGYDIVSYKSTKKEKKAKNEIVDEGWLCEIVYKYSDFWEV